MLVPSTGIDSVTAVQLLGKNGDQALDANSNDEIFGFRGEGGVLKYRTYNKQTGLSSGLSNINISKTEETKISVYIEIDLSTGKISVKCNEIDFVKDLDLKISEFYGIKFASGDSNVKTFNIDNLAVSGTLPTVNDYKAKYTTDVEALYNTYNLENYTKNKDELLNIKNTAVTNIAQAETKDAIIEIYNKCKNDLANVLTDAEVANLKEKANQIIKMIEELPNIETSSKTDVLASEDKIIAARTAYSNASDNIKKYIDESYLTILSNIENKLIEYKQSSTIQDNVETAKVNALEELDSLSNNYSTGYEQNLEKIKNIILIAKNKINEIDSNAVTEESLDSIIGENGLISSIINEVKTELKNVRNDLELTIDDKIEKLNKIYDENVNKYSEEYNKKEYVNKYQELLKMIKNCDSIEKVNEITFDDLNSIFTDEQQIAYNNLPTYGVMELSNTKDLQDFRKNTANDKLNNTVFGSFKIEIGSATKMKMNSAYLDLFSGNLIKFTVKNDGAVFMIGYQNNNAKRKVIISNDKYSEIKYCLNLNSSTNYKFNGENFELQPSAKGWLIFEGLPAGDYIVSFDDDSNPGIVDKAEQKIDGLVLLDKDEKSKEYKVSDINAFFEDKILKSVKLTLESNKIIELTEKEYQVEYYNGETKIDSSSDATSFVVIYKDSNGKIISKTINL